VRDPGAALDGRALTGVEPGGGGQAGVEVRQGSLEEEALGDRDCAGRTAPRDSFGGYERDGKGVVRKLIDEAGNSEN